MPSANQNPLFESSSKLRVIINFQYCPLYFVITLQIDSSVKRDPKILESLTPDLTSSLGDKICP